MSRSSSDTLACALAGGLLLAACAGAAAAGTKHVTFTLAPGASYSITLPVVGEPVQVMVSATFNNGGTQTPSEVASAVVNEDAKSLQVTWVGVSSDGTTHAGTTIPTGAAEVLDIGSGNVVATAVAGTGTRSTAYGTLKFTQSATQTAGSGVYEVTLID